MVQPDSFNRAWISVCAAGLFLWLGGLGFRRALVATVGAVSGGIFGFFMSGRNIMPAMVTAALAAVIAIKLEKIFIAILAGVLAQFFAFPFWPSRITKLMMQDIIQDMNQKT